MSKSNIQEMIFLENLNPEYVNIRKQNFYDSGDSKLQAIGNPWRIALQNSESGRKKASETLKEPYLSAVFSVWTPLATVSEKGNMRM